MINLLKRFLKLTGAVYLGVLLLLILLESTILYPAPANKNRDWDVDWLEREEAHFQSADGTQLHGWLASHPQAQSTILFCHGNGEDVSDLAEQLDFLRKRFRANVLVFDYRGYGKSGGRPFEAGVLADGEAALNWLSEKTGQPAERIVLFGRSLGGAVAVHLAAKHGARGVILDRTFNSMVDVAAHHFPWIPVRWLLRNRYPSAEKIADYQGPLLQFHGKVDEVVPFRCGYALFQACGSESKEFVTSETLTHNSAWPTEFYDRAAAFINELPQ